MMPSNVALDARGLPVGQSLHPTYEVSPRDAAQLLSDAGAKAVLIDCRTDEEFALLHVTGSLHLPLHEVDLRADELEIDDAAQVLVICHHGVRSMKAALALRAMAQAGHAPKAAATARSIAGGIDLWSVAVDPKVPRYERGPGGSRIVKS
jgi:rhodanese-related sulfurtransferase